jgi:hypothetical protein
MKKLKSVNRPVMSIEIEKLPKKSSRPDSFTNKFYLTLKKLMPILSKVFQNFQEE